MRQLKQCQSLNLNVIFVSQCILLALLLIFLLLLFLLHIFIGLILKVAIN